MRPVFAQVWALPETGALPTERAPGWVETFQLHAGYDSQDANALRETWEGVREPLLAELIAASRDTAPGVVAARRTGATAPDVLSGPCGGSRTREEPE